jgi:hypothetical protein
MEGQTGTRNGHNGQNQVDYVSLRDRSIFDHQLSSPLSNTPQGVLCSVPPFEGDKYLETD